MATIQTLTVLFTDIVASTALRARLGDALADGLQQRCDKVVAGEVAAAGGTVVKTLGDGLLATFASATAATAAAVAIQQAVDSASQRDPGSAVALRIGLAAGDVAVGDGDVSGLPVVEARRLCDAAEPDEILLTELTVALCGSRLGAAAETVGEVELRGLAQPVRVARLTWQPLGPAQRHGHGVQLPPLLLGTRAATYVGRLELRESLKHELEEALTRGPGRVALLHGEPGVGKTRTAAELAESAFQRGAIVLYGRCDEDVRGCYQPFAEALDTYACEAAAPLLGRLSGELTRLIPHLPSLVPGVGRPLTSDMPSEEFRLFESVVHWLIAAAEPQGLVLVLDDLHWADEPTVALLRHVVARMAEAEARVLVVGTFRDSDHHLNQGLVHLLADLRRVGAVTRWPIRGLRLEDVVDLMQAVAEHELDAAGKVLAGTLWSETDGNPFFVGEVLRHLREVGAIGQVDGRWSVQQVSAFEVPDSVREVVHRRLERLPEEARAVLAAAAVIGRDFSLDVLVDVAGVGEEAVLDALDLAIGARLVEETDVEHYRFAHALVRTTLHDTLSGARRRRRHRQVADALARLHPDDVLALAHHVVAAEPRGAQLEPALRWVLAAGEAALASRAPAEAVQKLSQAVAMAAGRADLDPLRARALCALGEAQRNVGDAAFRETLLEAAVLARSVGDAPLAARAVLANDRGTTLVSSPDPGRVEQINLALAGVGTGSSTLRARLLARLVVETTFSGEHGQRRATVVAAEKMARELGDPTTLAHVLVRTGMAAHRMDSPQQALVRAREGAHLAAATGDPALHALALSWVAACLIVLGDLRAATEVTEEMAVTAAEASPSVVVSARLARVKFLAATGDFPAARAENDACLLASQALREPDADMLWGATAGAIAMCEGDGRDLADPIGALADRSPTMPSWRVAQITFLGAAGRHAEARELLARHRLDPEPLMEEPFAFQVPFMLGEAAWRLDDAPLAARAQRLLEPFAAKWAHFYLGILGPVAWTLGRVALTLGDHTEGLRRLERAHADADRVGAHALAARIARDLEEASAHRGAQGLAVELADAGQRNGVDDADLPGVFLCSEA